MKSRIDARTFAEEWVGSWNSHDLERILSHYAEDVELISPNVVRYLGDPTGMVKGIQNLKDYFKRGLEKNPDLRFDLKQVFEGLASVTLCYHHSINQTMAAEVMLFNNEGKVNKVYAHYIA